MASSGAFNTRSAAVRRLLREAKEMAENPSQILVHFKQPLLRATPLDDNLFEWHFVIAGPEDSDFDGGLYHGRILLPPEYPLKPPSIIILTANGRFETNKKICLSISGYHPESWQPSWSIRTALLALIGFMPTASKGAIGGLDYPGDERKRLAKLSRDWSCKTCANVSNLTFINVGLLNNANSITPDESAVKLRAEREEAERLGMQLRMTEPMMASGDSNKSTTAASPNTGNSTATAEGINSSTLTSGDLGANSQAPATEATAATAATAATTTSLTSEQIRQRQRTLLESHKAEFQRRFQNATASTSGAAGGSGDLRSDTPWWFYVIASVTLTAIFVLLLRRFMLFIDS